MLKYCLYLFKSNEMTKEEAIKKLEAQIYVALLYERIASANQLKEVLTYLNKQQ